MANEDKKDFNAMLHDSKDMPKFQTSLLQQEFLYLLQHGRVTSVPKMKPRIGEP